MKCSQWEQELWNHIARLQSQFWHWLRPWANSLNPLCLSFHSSITGKIKVPTSRGWSENWDNPQNHLGKILNHRIHWININTYHILDPCWKVWLETKMKALQSSDSGQTSQDTALISDPPQRSNLASWAIWKLLPTCHNRKRKAYHQHDLENSQFTDIKS